MSPDQAPVSALAVDTVPDACERCEAQVSLILCIIHGWVCVGCWKSERHAECFVD